MLDLDISFTIIDDDGTQKHLIIEMPEDAVMDLAMKYLSLRLTSHFRGNEHVEYGSLKIGPHVIKYREDTRWSHSAEK